MREYNRIHVLCGKLVRAEPRLPKGADSRQIEAFVVAGVFTADDAAYLREHNIQFHGFDPASVGADVAVFETIFTNTELPRHIIGYADGHTVMRELNRKP
ncbi:MAG TPA: hypothetical protein VNZ64_05825 [Candidatus Acidoferrum sp.]|jgi:hypothetical protein|nr:hypothetical protein [Candidatus Acidoferrum sp.]